MNENKLSNSEIIKAFKSCNFDVSDYEIYTY